MIKLNNTRNYTDRIQINRMLSLMEGEVKLPPYYYNVHNLCKIQDINPVPQMVVLLKRLQDAGYIAVRTHFSPVSIKTNAPYNHILEAIRLKHVSMPRP